MGEGLPDRPLDPDALTELTGSGEGGVFIALGALIATLNVGVWEAARLPALLSELSLTLLLGTVRRLRLSFAESAGGLTGPLTALNVDV